MGGRKTKNRGREHGRALAPAAAAPRAASPAIAAWARWPFALIVCLALGLRLYRLEAIPIAGDESVYLRWAEIILHQKQWFISLLDGKQPLSYWMYALARLSWQDDPLFAARVVSAVAGVLSTVGSFAIARRVAGELAGIIAAFLYAVFPWALLYDRLAYTESLVNLAGIAIVYTSLRYFQDAERTWKGALVVGLALGLGFFTKSTTTLFGFFPLLAGVWLGRDRRRELVSSLAVIYGVALVFPLLAWAAVPRAPMMQTHSLVLHQTSFFVAPGELLRHPLAVAPANIRMLAEYIGAYVTLPVVLAAAAAMAYLIYRRLAGALVVFTVSWLPLLVQVFVLEKMFPTRYPFPHFWPWFVAIGAAVAALPWPQARAGRATIAAILAAAIALPAAVKGVCVVTKPQDCLYLEDSRTFVGSGASAGFGIREAADYLLREAAAGPMVVFTDAIWGPPADAMFAYLNERNGIRVYEAWWTTLDPNYPIVPPAPIEVLKSQYERVAGGVLNPATLGRVYYVTERAFTPPAVVRRREPAARSEASFLKPNGRDAIDVYRLR